MINVKIKCPKCEKFREVQSLRLYYITKDTKCKSCSLKGNKYRLGSKVSEETKIKIQGVHLGRKRTKETCKKISEGQKGKKRPHTQKENHYRWMADRSLLKKSDPERRSSAYMEWMKEVKKRDSFKCKMENNDCCGRLEAHHILGWKYYPELRYVVNNGITLCMFHHPRKKEEEKRLSPYFQSLLEKK